MKKISNILNKCNLFNKIANEEELTEGQKYYDIYSKEENLINEIKKFIKNNGVAPEELFDKLKEIRKELYNIDHNKDPEKYPSPDQISDKITEIENKIKHINFKINHNNMLIKSMPQLDNRKQNLAINNRINSEISLLKHELFELKDKHKTLLQIQSYLSGSIY